MAIKREYEVTVTLSHEQANKLVCYLLMSTNYRKRQRETWEKLAAETHEDGSPCYPNARGNADFWTEMDHDIEVIRNLIDDAPLRLKMEVHPAVDAVEVVRCRECAVPHNEMTGCPLLLGIRVDPDFYCKFGYCERREDGM